MEADEVIRAIRSQIDELEARGQQVVHIAGLRGYLNMLEQSASLSKEARQAQWQGKLAHYAVRNQFGVEMLKSVLDTGKHALDAVILINGGAVLAFLGVIGNLAGKGRGDVLAKQLADPLLCFGGGVLVAAIALALRYVSQALYSEAFDLDGSGSDGEGDGEGSSKAERFADWFRWGSVLAGVAGYVAFGVGMYFAYFAVRSAFG